MKIGVSGASGHLGKATMAELVAAGAGHQLVAITRTPEATSGAYGSRLGDYDHPETLLEAYKGLDQLLIIPSANMLSGVRGKQFRTAIDAAVEAGVGHIVLVSTAGTREAAEPSMFAAYWKGEQHLQKAAPQWTILRMNYYAESFAQMVPMSLASGVLTGLGENRVAFVSRDDVAAAAAGILLGKGRPGAIYNATGPVALSGAERAKVIAEATGKPLAFLTLEDQQLREELTKAGVPAAYVGSMLDIENKFLEGGFDIVTGDIERLSGRKPRTFKDVLSQTLK